MERRSVLQISLLRRFDLTQPNRAYIKMRVGTNCSPEAGRWKSLIRPESRSPAPARCGSRCRRAAFATAIRSSKKACFPAFNIRGCPGMKWPGMIDAVGAGVAGWKPGQRVGVGWNGGYCGHCDPCRRGEFFRLRRPARSPASRSTAATREYMIAPASAVALMPAELPAVDAAPLMCAGVTTFNALRNSGARPGDVVAMLGLGGLGHLGVQYAAKMGFHTVAIARGKDKEPLARQLGAAIISTARRRIRRRSCRSWAARRSSWPRSPAARR